MMLMQINLDNLTTINLTVTSDDYNSSTIISVNETKSILPVINESQTSLIVIWLSIGMIVFLILIGCLLSIFSRSKRHK